MTLWRCPIDPNTQKMIAIAIYAIILLAIGYCRLQTKMHDIKDYFRRREETSDFYPSRSPRRATGESAWLLLGLTGMGFALGVQAFWVVVGEIIGVGGAWLFMARQIQTPHRSNTTPSPSQTISNPDSATKRTDSDSSRPVHCLIFVPIYAGAQVFRIGRRISITFLDWNHYCRSRLRLRLSS